MLIPQITMRELLAKSSLYKEFLREKPRFHTAGDMPWRVYVQREENGRWAQKDFAKYAEAFNFMIRGLKTKGWHDAALHCKSTATPQRPSTVRKGKVVRMKMPPGHLWCIQCRRPTRFLWFKRHHAIPTRYGRLDHDTRCCICGISEGALPR